MTTAIKAIETRYKGYRFRSRLEARWAVFFDALGIKWEYEKEGYDLGKQGWYLPDFWLYDNENDSSGYWFEVKPHKNLNKREHCVANALRNYAPGYVMCGNIELPNYNGGKRLRPGETKGAPIHDPAINKQGTVMFSSVYKGPWAVSFSKFTGANFDPRVAMITEADDVIDTESFMAYARPHCWHERKDGSFVLWPMPSCEPYLLSEYGTSDPIDAGTKSINSPKLIAAYNAARAARFEHGETPQ